MILTLKFIVFDGGFTFCLFNIAWSLPESEHVANAELAEVVLVEYLQKLLSVFCTVFIPKITITAQDDINKKIVKRNSSNTQGINFFENTSKFRMTWPNLRQNRKYFNPFVSGPGMFELWKNWGKKIYLYGPFKERGIIKNINPLKGVCHEIFDLHFCSWFEPIQAPEKQAEVFSNSVSISRWKNLVTHSL